MQRWETGLSVPTAAAEEELVALCHERRLFRAYDSGPLAGMTLTPERFRHVLAEARLAARGTGASAVAGAGDTAAYLGTAPREAPAPPLPPSNLPAPLTRFIGRERELAEVRAPLPSARPLTLSGPGGAGKTRLGLEVARGVLEQNSDGVWLVELDALTDPVLIPHTVAGALGVREAPGRALTEVIVEHLVPLRLLTGGSRTAPSRQQTLQGTMERSWGLLTLPEKALCRRLAVFAGGWTLDTAEAVCAWNGVESAALMDLLTQLVDKSLVIAEEHDLAATGNVRTSEPATAPGHRDTGVSSPPLQGEGVGGRGQEVRYHFLEVIRQFAVMKLEEADETAAVRTRHRDWFLVLAERARPTGNAVDIAALLANLGVLARHQTEYKRALALHQESLELARAADDAAGTARALVNLGCVTSDLGDHTRAQMLLSEGVAMFRGLGNARAVAIALFHLGLAGTKHGDLTPARDHIRESLRLAWQMTDRPSIALCLFALAAVDTQEQRFERAGEFLSAAASLRRSAGSPLSPHKDRESEEVRAAIHAALGEAGFADAWARGAATPVDRLVALALDSPRPTSPDGRDAPSA